MLAGIAGIEQAGLSDGDWDLIETLVAEQLRQRIRMRNQQFGEPLAPARIAAIERGEIAPLAFDYRRAGLAA